MENLARALFAQHHDDDEDDTTVKPSLISDTIRNIDLNFIVDNPKNRKISKGKVQEYAQSILEIGMIEDPVVTPTSTGLYMILSGHHRIAACRLLTKENQSYQVVRCKVMQKDDIDAELVLLHGNIKNNPLSDYERMIAIGREEELLKMKQEKGTLRNKIAASTGLKPSQIQTNLTVYKKAIPEVLKAFENGDITLEKARNMAVKEPDEQRIMLQGTQVEKDVKALNLLKKTKAAIIKIQKQMAQVPCQLMEFPLMNIPFDDLLIAMKGYESESQKILDVIEARIEDFQYMQDEIIPQKCGVCEYCENDICMLMVKYGDSCNASVNVHREYNHKPHWCPLL